MFLLFLSGLILGVTFRSLFVNRRVIYWQKRCHLAEYEMLERQQLHNELRNDFETYIVTLRRKMTEFKDQQTALLPHNPEPRLSYLRGIYNGIELIHSSVEKREAQYK